MPDIQPRCDKPGCSIPAVKTYRGPHGNTLELCKEHYYHAVKSAPAGTWGRDLYREPIVPFWDSGIRCRVGLSDSTEPSIEWDYPTEFDL